MRIDVPDAAGVTGAVQSSAWRSDGLYTFNSLTLVAENTALVILKTDGNRYILGAGEYKVTSTTTIQVFEVPNKKLFGRTLYAVVMAPYAFRFPLHAKSATLTNRTGADMYFRQRIPNINGNVIDTETGSLSDEAIIGQVLPDNETVCWSCKDFSQEAEIVVVADTAAAASALVDFTC